ncbi:MAG: hypothetical protein ACPGO0_04370 [Acidimicrobiales bacterium]
MSIEDPKQLIEYVHGMAEHASRLEKPGDFELAVENLKGDIENIENEKVRKEAMRVWRIFAAIDQGYSSAAMTALSELGHILEEAEGLAQNEA